MKWRLTSCACAACAPVFGPFLQRLMASLAQLSTSWCRSLVKVTCPFWVLEAEGVGPGAWVSEAEWFWQWPEPFKELVPLDPGKWEERWDVNYKIKLGNHFNGSLRWDQLFAQTCGVATEAGHGRRGSERLYGRAANCLGCLCARLWDLWCRSRSLLWRGSWGTRAQTEVQIYTQTT